jgi:hypothetical protein
MSDYVKATNFYAKDALLTGNPDKLIKGAEIDAEYNAIATAVATKANLNSPNFTGTPTVPTAPAITNTTQAASTAFVTTALANAQANVDITGGTIDGVDITGGTITGITDLLPADGGTGRSTLSAKSVLVGNGTDPVNFIAPSTAGNVLTSNGTDWESATPVGGIGNGQTWQDVTGSRALGTTYTNNTGKPIMVVVTNYNGGANGVFLQITVGGVQILNNGGWPGGGNPMYATGSVIVPNGVTYSASNSGGGGLNRWVELR